MNEIQAESQVQQFYSGAKIFLTGGTGFLGKLIVEKLLRSTEVEAIYFLIRAKKEKSIHSRLDEYFDDVIFQRLKTENTKFKSKIIGIPGDCSLAGLGLSIEDTQLLINNVDVVFHVAATVNFTEKLNLAYAINVKGTDAILNLCRQMKHLKACVHVSTIYAQCHLKEIDEAFYDMPVNYRELDGILAKMDDEEVERFTPKILGKWPNTYTLTKAMAECLVKNEGSGLPIAIFRPGIVISTYKEPIAGWIDNMYGPTGICAGAASGIIRIACCKFDCVANIVPADTCVASLIVTAWDIANRSAMNNSQDIPIYNYSSTEENPITWGEFLSLNRMWADVYPVSNSAWSLHFETSDSRLLYNVKKVVYHTVPAFLVDIFAVCTGQKPRMLKLYSKVHKLIDVLAFFSNKEWRCNNMNVVKMWNKMSVNDRDIFPFSMEKVHWTSFFKNYMLGIRKYLLKDTEQTIEKARKRHLRFEIIHQVMKFLLLFLFFTAVERMLRFR